MTSFLHLLAPDLSFSGPLFRSKGVPVRPRLSHVGVPSSAMIRSLLTLSPFVVVVALTTWGLNPEMWYRATPLGG